ncbi:MAG: hypothetical protein ACE5GO_04540 [Anaerolineales bacterium]
MKARRGNIIWGSIMILLGVFFLAVQLVPDLDSWIGGNWPVIIIGVGALFLLAGILTGTPSLTIPAAIVGGIGGLLFWQNATGNWETWAYAWTFIPGFVGVGLTLFDLFRGKFRLPAGGPVLIFISLILFAIFGSFLGGPVEVLRFWPVLLIGIGAWQLIRALFRRDKSL